MKKSIIFLIVLTMLMVVVGCKPESKPVPKPLPMSIDLKSETQQTLKIGADMKIMFSPVGTTQGTVLVSSDPSIVTVDEFANVVAVGEGTAKVKISLVEDPTIFVEVTFTTIKLFFLEGNDFRVGENDLTKQQEGTILLQNGQSQVAVNHSSQHWILKASLTQNDPVGKDWYGGWGLGSYRIGAGHAMGGSMYWFGLQRKNKKEADTLTNAYYGGWGLNLVPGQGYTDYRVDDTKDFALTDKVDLTLIRNNAEYYMIAQKGDVLAKAMFKLDLFKDIDTYPAVYAQNALVTVTDYSLVTGEANVEDAVNRFQGAENVKINVVDTRLINGKTYNLTSTVLPQTTGNKKVEYSIADAPTGVTITKDGELTLSATATGTFKVTATSLSNDEVKDVVQFTAIAKPTSTSTLFETGMVVKNTASSIVFGEKSATVTVGEGVSNYIPLAISGKKWHVKANIKNTSAAPTNTNIGIMSAKDGYMHYLSYGFLHNKTGDTRDMQWGEKDGTKSNLAYSLPGGIANDAVNAIELIKDGKSYHLFINGQYNRKIEASFDDATMPVLYSHGASVEFTNVEVNTNATEIDTYIASYKYKVGGYVKVDNGTYTLGSTGVPGSDWPPDNQYTNGLLLNETLKGDYTIEFKMSAIKPVVDNNGGYDAKIMVYLRSEKEPNHTSSLHFIINKQADVAATETAPAVIGAKKQAITANWNDMIWDQHLLPESIDLLTGEHTIKVVKTLTKVQLFIDNVEIAAGQKYMENNNYWTSELPCTPGLGTYRCGVTLRDVAFTKN